VDGERIGKISVLGLVRTIVPFFLLMGVNGRRNDWAREVDRVGGATVRDIPPEEVRRIQAVQPDPISLIASQPRARYTTTIRESALKEKRVPRNYR